jgi:hypothetical protein
MIGYSCFCSYVVLTPCGFACEKEQYLVSAAT